jgi:hypothetical protein
MANALPNAFGAQLAPFHTVKGFTLILALPADQRNINERLDRVAPELEYRSSSSILAVS